MTNSNITPSDTPLKRYQLNCPTCNEETIVLPAADPDKPYCPDCDQEVDLEDLSTFIENWLEYLRDREALLTKEKGA